MYNPTRTTSESLSFHKENVEPLNTSRISQNQFNTFNKVHSSMSLDERKQKFEQEISINVTDPIDPWDRYLDWMLKNASVGIQSDYCQQYLQKFFAKFSKSPRYKSDPRFVNAWLVSCDHVDDAFQLFDFMDNNGIGATCASFYVAWAEKYEAINKVEEAQKIYKQAVEKNAQPSVYLKQQKMAFERRRFPPQNITSDYSSLAAAAGNLSTNQGTHQESLAPSSYQTSQDPPQPQEQPRKKLPYELQEEAMIRSLNGAPPNEPGKKRMYDVTKVYSTIGEMEFQQIRAAWWRKRQQQMTRKQEQMSTEEMHRKIQELEAELQNIKLQKQRGDLEQVRYEQDEEDITTRIHGIRRQMRKSLPASLGNRHFQDENDPQAIGGMQQFPDDNKDAAAGFTFNNENDIPSKPVQNENPFQIYADKTEETNLPQTLEPLVPQSTSSTNVLPAKSPSPNNFHSVSNTFSVPSNNSSLNFSKRSLPSPTLHTKEALAFFEPCMQASLDNVSQLQMPQTVHYNDPVPDQNNFSIFKDDDTAAIMPSIEVCAPKQQNNFEIFHESNIAVGKEQQDDTNVAELENTASSREQPRLSSAFHPTGRSRESLIKPVLGALPQATTNNALKPITTTAVDKTLFLDDVTVAGRHFAAKAHLASTPFTGRLPQGDDEMWDDDISQIGFATEFKEPTAVKPEPNSLSTIMEASHETNSTKSSTKSRTESEGDKTNKSSINQPHQNNFADFLMPTSSSARQKQQTTAIEGYEDLCDLLPDSGKSSNKEAGNFFGFLGSEPSSTSALSHDKSLSVLSADSPSGQTGSTTVTLQNRSSSLNIIPNPWDEKFVDGILAQTQWHKLPLIEINDVNTRLTKNYIVRFGEKSFKMDQLIGEGNFAKVHKVSPINGKLKEKYVIKVQKPACPMEIYTLCEAKLRLEDRGLAMFSEKIINIHRAYLLSNASILLLPYYEHGTLLNYLNSESLSEQVVLSILVEIMEIVHALHTVSIIHGDIKPDNFIISQKNHNGMQMKLIDFGRAIDMSLVPNNAVFTASCNTSGFECIQMRQKQPWNYHIDYFGIAGILYVMLAKSYIRLQQKPDGKWTVESRYFKRLYQSSKEHWLCIIECLLNHETPHEGQPAASSPLPGLISELCNHAANNNTY